MTWAGDADDRDARRVRRLIVGISGASGAVYGVRVLEALRRLGVETEVIVTAAGAQTLRAELDLGAGDIAALADRVHSVRDIGATVASGSYPCDGMIVAPCSVRTLSNIAHSNSDNLLSRAADVMLKERRRLVLMFRETPLHLGHLRLLVAAAELGAQIFPPVPAFYQRPSTIDEIVDHTVARVLDQFGLDAGAARWPGLRPAAADTDTASPPAQPSP